MSDLTIEKRGHAGMITLNRPKALNALTIGMCREISAALDDFAKDSNIAHVVMRSSENGRFFCAGGDIRTLQMQLRNGVYAEAEDFFRTEYRMNRKIARFLKPYISLIDGVVMGGGVGISGHGTFRVVTQNTVFAMPEVGIGFFPDVGASRLLAALPNHIGAYLAITGERINAADMMHTGLATHFIRAENFENILAGLETTLSAVVVLDRFSEVMGESHLSKATEIPHYFSDTNLISLHARLVEKREREFESKCITIMAARSPTSMAIALRQLCDGAKNIEDTLIQDFRIACRIIREHDFPEGVRAVLIDKDHNALWEPATLNSVDNQRLEGFFAPLPSNLELNFDE